MKKRTYAVIGLGKFGISIVEELSKHDADVIAIDVKEEQVKAATRFVPTAFVADSTDEKALKELDMENVDVAIVAFGNNVQATILTTVLLKEFKVEHIIVRMDDEYFVPIVKKLGADEVITPQKMAGFSLANRLGNNSFLDYYSLGDDFSAIKLSVDDDFKEELIQEINPRNTFNANLILISRDGKTFAPKGTDSVKPGDIIFVVGKLRDVEKFGRYFNK